MSPFTILSIHPKNQVMNARNEEKERERENIPPDWEIKSFEWKKKKKRKCEEQCARMKIMFTIFIVLLSSVGIAYCFLQPIHWLLLALQWFCFVYYSLFLYLKYEIKFAQMTPFFEWEKNQIEINSKNRKGFLSSSRTTVGSSHFHFHFLFSFLDSWHFVGMLRLFLVLPFRFEDLKNQRFSFSFYPLIWMKCSLLSFCWKLPN